MIVVTDEPAPWEVDPDGNPLTDSDIDRIKQSIYYERFSDMLRTVPSLRHKREAWAMLSNTHKHMDQMKTFRSRTNSRNADLAIRVAILESELIGWVGYGCVLNRFFEAPSWGR